MVLLDGLMTAGVPPCCHLMTHLMGIDGAGTLTAVRLRVKMLGAAVRRGALPRGIAAAEAPEPRATRQQVGRVLRQRTQIRTYREGEGLCQSPYVQLAPFVIYAIWGDSAARWPCIAPVTQAGR